MLNYRATDDCKNFGKLVELRLVERKAFFEEILKLKKENAMQKTSEKFKKLSIK